MQAFQRVKAENNRMIAIRREEFVFKKLIEEVEQCKNPSSRIRALELLGKTVSMFSNKVETKTKKNDRTSEEIIKDLKFKLNKLIEDHT